MTRNYDTTQGLPYIRVNDIKIQYGIDDSDLIRITANEYEAVILANGKTYITGKPGENGSLKPIDRVFTKHDLETGSFSLINPATGATTGQTMTYFQLYQAMTSLIRQIQESNV